MRPEAGSVDPAVMRHVMTELVAGGFRMKRKK
jgi:hypothetical protein